MGAAQDGRMGAAQDGRIRGGFRMNGGKSQDERIRGGFRMIVAAPDSCILIPLNAGNFQL